MNQLEYMTERKRRDDEMASALSLLQTAQEALRASEARFRAAFESSGIGMVLSMDGVWTEVNQAFCQMLGYPESDLVGRSYLDFAVADDVTGEQTEVERLIHGEKQLHTFDHRFRHRSGRTVWVRVHRSAIRGRDGSAEYLLAEVEDITAAKETQEQLLESRLESAAKSREAATMSHEVRTPLNSILGFAELLGSDREGHLTDKQLRYVGNIESGGRHLLALVNDSLDLSRLKADRTEIHLVALELRPILEYVVNQQLPFGEARDLDFRLDAPKSATVQADRRRLLQILFNLLSNAVKHTPASGSITVSARSMPTSVDVSVRDTGPGIAYEQQERIFQEFSQVGDQLEGTGLGLPISRRLARLMGGELRISSEPGEGCTFTLSLPTARPIESQACSSEEPALQRGS